MAVTFQGFSIRDYTSRMRSVDVYKCWPFAAGRVSREDVESWLPPMTVPKSRWWSAKIAGLRSNHAGAGQEAEAQDPSNEEGEPVKEDKSLAGDGSSASGKENEKEEEEKMEMVCPVCRDFNAATLTAVNAHIDGCLAKTMREERRQMKRMKSKALKKRSIAEIFDLKESEEEENPPPEIETVLKLWPLDADEVSITVTKLRWLSRRLEELRSNGVSRESLKSDKGIWNFAKEEEKFELVCPVCRVFNAATVTAVNAHIDGCLAKAMKDEMWQMRKLSLNPKPKAPKKRSIAEILTVAPQIDGELLAEAEEEDEGEMNREEFDKSGFSGSSIKSQKITNKSLTKKKKMKKVTNKKSKVEKRSAVPPNNESKKKKIKKNSLNNEFTVHKEYAYKRKMQHPLYSSGKLDTIGNKKVKLNNIDASSVREKRLGLKVLSEEKKEKVDKCDSIGKQQKALSPIRNILKNQKHISGSTSNGSNIQDGAEENNFDVQVPSSDRHSIFSAKDYLLGPKKSNSTDETMFNLSSDVLASSLGKEQSSGSDEGNANMEENGNDNIANNTEKRTEVRPVVEIKQFSDTLGQVDVQNFLKPCINQEKSKHLVEKPESLPKVAFCDNNLQRFDRGNTTTTHFCPYADVCRSPSAFQVGQTSGINTQACESEAFGYNAKFFDHLVYPAFQSATVQSNANPKTYLESSPSYSAFYDEGNERPEFPLQTGDNDNNGQALGGRSWSGMFSADMINNSLLLPGGGKGSIRNNFMEQNFFGLPLNSHGELINFSSSGKSGINQPETSCTSRGSLSGLPVNNVIHQNSQEYLSIGKRHFVQKTLQDRLNPLPYYSGRLGAGELHGRESFNHYVQPPDSELNLMRNPFIEQNQLDKVPNHKEYGMVSPGRSSSLVSPSSNQPTMRLMGKDVPIGRSSKEKQQFAGEVLWADEESRRRHCSVDAAKDNSLLGRCSMQDLASGSQLQIPTENVLQSVKIQSNLALQSSSLMKDPNSDFLKQQSNHITQVGILGASRNASSNLNPFTQTSTSCAIYNKAPFDMPEQFISAAKPQGHCFQSRPLPTPCNFSQPTLSNGEMNEWKKHQHVTNSAFRFPFLHSVVEEQAKQSWFKRSYRSLQSYDRLPGSSSGITPQNTWRTNHTIASVNHSADVLYPSNSVTPHCPRKSHLCSALIAQRPHASVIPVNKPPSATNNGCRNILKATDRVKLEYMTAKELHPCTNPRKRPAVNLVDPAKPNKLPSIEVQKNSSRMTGLARETSRANLVQNTSS